MSVWSWVWSFGTQLPCSWIHSPPWLWKKWALGTASQSCMFQPLCPWCWRILAPRQGMCWQYHFPWLASMSDLGAHHKSKLVQPAQTSLFRWQYTITICTTRALSILKAFFSFAEKSCLLRLHQNSGIEFQSHIDLERQSLEEISLCLEQELMNQQSYAALYCKLSLQGSAISQRSFQIGWEIRHFLAMTKSVYEFWVKRLKYTAIDLLQQQGHWLPRQWRTFLPSGPDCLRTLSSWPCTLLVSFRLCTDN